MTQKTKNLYVRKESEVVWKDAEALAGDQSMAGLVEDLLRRFIEEKTCRREGRFAYSQIMVRPQDCGNPVLRGIEKKVFKGHLLVNGQRALPCYDAKEDEALYHFVAISPKGKIVYWNQQTDSVGTDGVRDAEIFRIYDNLQQASDDYPPEKYKGEHQDHRMGPYVLDSSIEPDTYWYALIPPEIIQSARDALDELGYEYTDVMDI